MLLYIIINMKWTYKKIFKLPYINIKNNLKIMKNEKYEIYK